CTRTAISADLGAFFGSFSRTFVADLALICTVWPDCPVRAVPGVARAIRTVAAFCGADNTISVVPAAPAGLAASTPCSLIAAAPVMNAPGAPGGRPVTWSTAVTGTLADILIEPGNPLSAGRLIPVVRWPRRGMALPPVGR